MFLQLTKLSLLVHTVNIVSATHDEITHQSIITTLGVESENIILSDSQRNKAAKFSQAVRHSAAPIRYSFTDATDGVPSPLASVMRGAKGSGGGRGGGTRLAVLLTLIWVLRSGLHDSDRPARVWAELIGLEDPKGDGARAVRDSLHELAKRRLLSVDSVDGQLLVQLLREDASGRPYSSPVASKPGASVPEPYFRIPAALWENGVIGKLSGPGLAMLVIVMRTLRTDLVSHKIWFSPSTFKEKFSLGDSTRKAGLRELVEQGVLIEEMASTDAEGGTDYRLRKRKTYLVEPAYWPHNPKA